MKKTVANIILGIIISGCFFILHIHENSGIIHLMKIIISMLIVSAIIGFIMKKRKIDMGYDIFERTITWWWMSCVFFLAVSTHRIITFFFMALLCFLALKEYFDLNAEKKDIPRILCYMSIFSCAFLAAIEWYMLFIIFIPVYIFLLIPVYFALQNRIDSSLRDIGMVTAGIMFFVYNLGHSMFMINMGPAILLYCFFITEARDIISYFSGKTFHMLEKRSYNNKIIKLLNIKIADRVSPKKTWATAILTMLLTGFVSLWLSPHLPEFEKGSMSGTVAFVTGLIIGMLGAFGDLVFSMIKRDIGIKDSGDFLPGHGGIIDRVDGLVFTVPVVFHIIYWLFYY
ncbi:MAG: phosphatidate cytidylyltransferase [Candidatus Muiribacteriaceae bacterium]